MAVFKSYDELFTYFSNLYDQAKRDSRIAPKIRDEHIVIQFRYEDPHAVATVSYTHLTLPTKRIV